MTFQKCDDTLVWSNFKTSITQERRNENTMKSVKKSNTKNSVGRLMYVLCSFLLQTIWVVLILSKLNEYSFVISGITTVISVIAVLHICSNDINADMKIAWIILILVFPVMGIVVYVMYGRKEVTKKQRLKYEKVNRQLETYLWNHEPGNVGIEDPAVANQCYYLEKHAGYPVYRNTEVKYYKDAMDGWKDQLDAVRQAEKFIFLEYHAIENAKAFLELKDILLEKVKNGVEVRIVYDDVGSIGFITPEFVKDMEKSGIQCRIFNQIMPAMRIFMQNRDHRKIMVIDGKVGFTGGYNLADEYFNLLDPGPYGYWKDTGARLIGEAVDSLTATFLEMWNFIKKTDVEFQQYFRPVDGVVEEQSETSVVLKNQEQSGPWVQPYADSPLDDELVGENVYLNMIKNAKKFIWFTTPYLVISDVLCRELRLAAKRGVDVRIITPGIPDKKMVYEVTRSSYPDLLKDGVRIYEYTPGFCHAKQCICDDETAVIGTINLDYRSLYHHFENGVLLYQAYDFMEDMKKDFTEMFEIAREVPVTYGEDRSFMLRMAHEFLHLFATLL